MPCLKNKPGSNFRSVILCLIMPLMVNCIASCGDSSSSNRGLESVTTDEYPSVDTMLILPKNPGPGEAFCILAIGEKNIRKAQIIVSGPSGILESLKSKIGEELPYWRIDHFTGSSASKYTATLIVDKKVVSNLAFIISPREKTPATSVVWKTLSGWDSSMEAIYSAWINALFHGCDEQASWPALHDVIQNQNQNFLYNYLSLGEDDPNGNNRLIMQPDCADNPFFLRAYFSWKLGLPFGYHLCDRGSLAHTPKTGQWITNESPISKTNPALAFNAFLRRVMNDVNSGLDVTALDADKSEY